MGSGSEGESVRVWDVERGGAQVGNAFTEHAVQVVSVAVSADGRRAVSGWRDSAVRVWDVETGAEAGDCSQLRLAEQLYR